MNDLRLVLSTFPDLETARKVATSLVERQLAACANLIPNVESIFHWDGEVQQSGEILVIFKTTLAGRSDMIAALTAIHPYEVPEVISLPVEHVAEAYRQWVISRVGSV